MATGFEFSLFINEVTLPSYLKSSLLFLAVARSTGLFAIDYKMQKQHFLKGSFSLMNLF